MNRKVQVNRQQHFLGVVLKGSMLRMENVIAVEYCTLYNRCTVVITYKVCTGTCSFSHGPIFG